MYICIHIREYAYKNSSKKFEYHIEKKSKMKITIKYNV